jgi:hypothetical protein
MQEYPETQHVGPVKGMLLTIPPHWAYAAPHAPVELVVAVLLDEEVVTVVEVDAIDVDVVDVGVW